MKSGRILRVPDKEELAAIPQPEARREVRVQVADWNAYRQGVADSAGTARAEGRSAVSGRIGTKVEDKAGSEPKDVVRLSRGEPPGAAGAGKGKPRTQADRIRALEEEVTARDKALNDANVRIAQLEKTVKDMQKLVELKSPGMAAAQQQAQQATKPKPKPSPSRNQRRKPRQPEPAPATKPESSRLQSRSPPNPSAEAGSRKTGAAETGAPKAEAAKPAIADAKAPDAKAEAGGGAQARRGRGAEHPSRSRKSSPRLPATAGAGYADQVMSVLTNPLYLLAGAGIIALGGLALWMARRRASRMMTNRRERPPSWPAGCCRRRPRRRRAAVPGVR